jgi:hypothetical protein
VLAEYDRHGRVIGGEPEQMMDAAAAAYVARVTGIRENQQTAHPELSSVPGKT